MLIRDNYMKYQADSYTPSLGTEKLLISNLTLE